MNVVRILATVAFVVAMFIAHGLKIQSLYAQQTLPNQGPFGDGNSWDKNLPAAQRFTILLSFNNEAVRDNNTGLVWEKAPNTTYRTWYAATSACLGRTIGGTTGWRLPSIAELMSVLPVPINVFPGVQAVYWSASSVAEQPTTHGYVADVGSQFVAISLKSNENLVWCVRGPTPPSVY